MDDRDRHMSEIIAAQAGDDGISGRFVSLALISADGFTSIVFRAHDRKTGKPIVLKFLKPWADSYRKACFGREAQITGLLHGHENIIQVAAPRELHTIELVDRLTGMPVPFPIEYFGIEPARSTFSRLLFGHSRPRRLLRRLQVVRDVAKGLNRLHTAGYCHRDLKPDNVLLFRKGVAKLADLGTTRLLSGTDPLQPAYYYPAGDFGYSAPELFNGGANDPACHQPADWFSVGAILFEAVTGQNLYVSIGLRGASEISSALRVSGVFDSYADRVAEISGRYPVPSTVDYAAEAWLTETRATTHTAISDLIRDLCHFDPRRRLTDFQRVLGRLDLILGYVKADEVYARRRRAGERRER